MIVVVINTWVMVSILKGAVYLKSNYLKNQLLPLFLDSEYPMMNNLKEVGNSKSKYLNLKKITTRYLIK